MKLQKLHWTYLLNQYAKAPDEGSSNKETLKRIKPSKEQNSFSSDGWDRIMRF